MGPDLHPVSVTEITEWQQRNASTLTEARQRYVMFVILNLMSRSAALRESLAFKGGNALRYCFGNKRTTSDLDFTASPEFPADKESIRRLLDDAFRPAISQWAVFLRSQRITSKPPKGTHPTFEIMVGYAFHTDRHFRDFSAGGRSVSTTVPIEISINDVVCDAQLTPLLSSKSTRIRCCVLEDILAEKLRALLQQRQRHGGISRRQDLHDIVRIVRQHGPSIDRQKVAKYFSQKAAARNITASASAFDERIYELAKTDWESLFDAFNTDFIPVEEAWRELIEFIASLHLD